MTLETDDGQTQDPQEPGVETDTDSLEGGTAPADSGEAGEGSTPDAGSGSGEDGEGGETPSGKKGSYDRLLEKYGGDPEKLADGVWNQAKSLSDLTKKVDSLTQMLARATTPPEPDVDEVIKNDQTVRQAADEVRSLDANIREATESQNGIIRRHGELSKKVERLQGKLEAMDDDHPKRGDVKDELRDLRSELRTVDEDYRRSKADIRDLQRDLQKAAVRFRDTENEAKRRVEQERNNNLTRKQKDETIRTEFHESVEESTSQYGIPTGSPLFNLIHKNVKLAIAERLRDTPKGAPGIDFDVVVPQLVDEFLEQADLKSKFQKTSRRKQQVSNTGTGNKGNGIPSPPPKPGQDQDGEWTAEYAKKRAAELMP